jgi:glutamate racemase
MKIGVFDSGIGGLTVLKPLLKSQLFSEVIYFGDTARVPYGSKDKNIVVRYSLEAVEFFKNFDIEILIVACNTASAYALEFMRKEANFPVFGVIESGVLRVEKHRIQAQKKASDLEILVIGTKATIKTDIYSQLLTKIGFSKIQNLATGLFVPIVEEGVFSGKLLNSVLEHYFKDIKSPDIIVLGCTHFPLISDEIKNYFLSKKENEKNNIFMLHSGEAIIDFLTDEFFQNMDEMAIFKKTETKFFASENPSGLREVAEKWLSE